jgi:hypothetical protein
MKEHEERGHMRPVQIRAEDDKGDVLSAPSPSF